MEPKRQRTAYTRHQMLELEKVSCQLQILVLAISKCWTILTTFSCFRNFTSIAILQGDVASRLLTLYVCQKGRSKFGFKIGEWSTKRTTNFQTRKMCAERPILQASPPSFSLKISPRPPQLPAIIKPQQPHPAQEVEEEQPTVGEWPPPQATLLLALPVNYLTYPLAALSKNPANMGWQVFSASEIGRIL